jgi:hypothetical protein
VYEKIDDQRFKQVVHFLSGSSTRQLILKALDSFFEDLIGSWIWKTSRIQDEDLWQGICSVHLFVVRSLKDLSNVVNGLPDTSLKQGLYQIRIYSYLITKKYK